MVILKRIGVLSLAKLETIIMAIFGFFAGIFYAIFPQLINTSSVDTAVGNPFGWWGVIIFPIIYAILGFVIGVIGAWVYNLLARWVGGIELELSK
jgi:hypothetical protein